MATTFRIPLGRVHQINSSGVPLGACKLYVYQTTTTTAVSLFSDRSGSSSAANPIVADSTGRLPFRYTTYTGLLTLVLKDSDGNTIWSDDNIKGESSVTDLLGWYNVKEYGAAGDGSTDDTTYIQSAATACRTAGGGVLYFPSGTYIITQAILLGSGTRALGCGDSTTVKAHQSAFVGTNAGNNCYLFRNYNHAVSSLTDENIVVESICFDYGTVTISGGGAHAISMKYVNHVTVRDCHFTKGENATGFVSCQDTITDACHALNTANCGFDSWGGAGNNKVLNSTVRITSGTCNQGIQCTGTGSLGEDLSTTDCLVANCSVYGVRHSDAGSAIISNANDADSTTYRFRSHANYIEDCDNGLVFSGEGGHHVSDSDTLRNVTKLPIFLQTANSDAPDFCRVINPTLIDCNHSVANAAMIAISGTNHQITGVKVNNTSSAAYLLIAYFAPSSANNLLQIDRADAGSTGSRWQNDGSATTNRIIDYNATLQANVTHLNQERSPAPGMLSGMGLANGSDATNDIDFAAGFCADSTGVALIMSTSTVTKQLDATFAAGTNQGGLDGGTVGNGTYHCHAIRKDVSGNGDFIFSLSHDKSATCTMTIASPGVVTMTAHGLVAGSPIKFTTTGALPTGVTAGTQYYVISTGLTADAFQFSTSIGGAAVNTSGSQSGTHTCYPGPALPSGYTYFRRVGSIIRSGGTILAFTQNADEFLLKVPVAASDSASPGTSQITKVLQTPVGIVTDAIVTTGGVDATPAAATYGLAIPLALTDTTPTSALFNWTIAATGATNPNGGWANLRVRTNTASSIGLRVDASTADLTLKTVTHGWIDTRGRLV